MSFGESPLFGSKVTNGLDTTLFEAMAQYLATLRKNDLQKIDKAPVGYFPEMSPLFIEALARMLAPQPFGTSLGANVGCGLGTTLPEVSPWVFEALAKMLAPSPTQHREPMSADQYLRSILAREKVDTTDKSQVLGVQQSINPLIHQ